MEKSVEISKKSKKISVNINMSFDEFQDLRSYMNVAVKERNFDFVDKCFSNVPSLFHKCLKSD